MLATIGEAPVNALDVATTSDAINALSRLQDTSRQVQGQSYWSFNTDVDVTVDPDSGGNIVIPPNVLRTEIDRTKNGWNADYVVRSGKIYDRKQKTFNIGTQFYFCKMSYLQPFEELPQTARWYITIKSARVFAAQVTNDQIITGFTQQDEMEAKRDFLEDQFRQKRPNLLRSPSVRGVVYSRRAYNPWF